jgi:hypothetical protein
MTKPKTKKREYSFGTLSLIETASGELRLAVDVEQVETTSEEIMHRIRSLMSGLAYMYNRNGDTIEGLGEAYIEGMETGIHAMQAKIDKDKGGSNSGDGGPTMGFRANL